MNLTVSQMKIAKASACAISVRLMFMWASRLASGSAT
jgi:hypothetical protein